MGYKLALPSISVNVVVPGGSVVENPPANEGDPGSIPGSGRAPGEGNGYPLQYSCLENPMDRGAWWATVLAVAKSWTQVTNIFSQCVKLVHFFHDFRVQGYVDLQANQSQLPHWWTFRLRIAFLVPNTTAGYTPHTHLWALSSFPCAECQALFSTPVILSGYHVLRTRSQKICFHSASWYLGCLPGSLGGTCAPLTCDRAQIPGLRHFQADR